MKTFALFITIFLSCATALQAQDSLPYVKKSFVIIKSTKDYTAAKAVANSASARLNIKLDLRGLKANKKSGLTFSDADCENEGGFPCYVARGRWGDGEYVSVEWSSAYQGFTKGYYIVIVASGNEEDVKYARVKARKVFMDAYVKTTEVYIGCMH